MGPSLQTMGFFMSDINFCNTKEQLNHLGEVVTGKVDGSPTGADIDTSTLPYTGQVRKTLPALEGEYEQSITNKEIEADAAIDSYRLLNKGPYASGITLESKFEYITYNGESYFATNPPYTTTATTPDADGNLFAGGYINQASISNYTDIVYKASGGSTAVENMISGHPVTIEIGDTCQCENGSIFKKVSAAGNISDFEPQSDLHWKDFGVIGTGYPLDDGPALNFYASSCRENGWDLHLPHTIDKVKIYTAETIDFQGIDVYCDKPAIIDFGSMTEDSLGFSLLTGLPSGRPTASTVYGMDYRFDEGVCIYSDVASPVVKISSKRKLSIGVSGWLELAGQHCIEDEFNATYQTVVFPWGEVMVSGSGDDGIALKNGIEISDWEHVTAKQCNGHGVNTEGGGGDNNQEYFSARFCNFVSNRLDGFNMSTFKKNVSFYKCGLNSNGWYGYGPSESVPKPSSPRDTVGGVKISGAITSASVLSFVENYGEDCARIASLFLDYPIRNLEFRKNNLFPTLNLTDPASDLNNHLLGLFSLSGGSVGQIYDAEIDQNAAQNTSRSKIITGDIMPANLFDFYIGPNQDLDPASYDFGDFSRITNNKVILTEQLTLNKHLQVGRDLIGDGTAQTFVSSYIKDNLRESGQGNSTWSVGACFLVTANWQATNAQQGGAYLVYAFVLPDGQVKGESQVIGSGSGFSAAPTVSLNGDLNVPLSANYRGSVTRIDMSGERA